MTISFSDFALSPAVLRGIEALGFDTPTPVQQEAIPLLLARRDAIVQAKTGSGKTLAFALPLLTMLKRAKAPQALVVVPTRELAQQVEESFASVAKDTPLRTIVLYGGVGLGPQEQRLRAGADVVVGTPGRLKDLLGRGSLDLSAVSALVLDEADEMLDKGFRRDIEFLIRHLPSRQQTLIFSATMPPEIEAIARTHLKDPAVVKLTVAKEAMPTEVVHEFVRVRPENRLETLVALMNAESPERGIIFTRTKRETKVLANRLHLQAGLEAGFLNGNMSQNARNTMLARFKSGDFRFLVATDVAARGLDVEGLTHVFHYAVPTVVETYIHRSGRTGRAGNSGKTIILVLPEEAADFKAISKRVHMSERFIDAPKLDVPVPPEPPRGQRPGRAKPKADQAPREQHARVQQPREPQPGRGQQPRDAAPRSQDARATRAPREQQQAPAPRPQDARPARGQEPRAPRGQQPQGARPEGQRSQQAPAWVSLDIKLRPGHNHSSDSLQHWISQRARVSPRSLRAVRLNGDHATFEVEAPVAERLMASLKGGR